MKKYVVRPGDTMWAISKTTGVRLNLLIAANPQIQDPNRLQPGSIVAVPELYKSKTKSKKLASTKTGAGSSSKPLGHYVGYVWPHKVTQNETWGSIAKKYGLTVEQLHLMNPEDTVVLKPGDVIYIPSLPKHSATGRVPGEAPSHNPAPLAPGAGMSSMNPYGPYDVGMSNITPRVMPAGTAPYGAGTSGAGPGMMPGGMGPYGAGVSGMGPGMMPGGMGPYGAGMSGMGPGMMPGGMGPYGAGMSGMGPGMIPGGMGPYGAGMSGMGPGMMPGGMGPYGAGMSGMGPGMMPESMSPETMTSGVGAYGPEVGGMGHYGYGLGGAGLSTTDTLGPVEYPVPYGHGTLPLPGEFVEHPPGSAAQEATPAGPSPIPTAPEMSGTAPGIPPAPTVGGPGSTPMSADIGPHTHYPNRSESSPGDEEGTLGGLPYPYRDLAGYIDSQPLNGNEAADGEWQRGTESWPESTTWDVLVDTPWNPEKPTVQFGSVTGELHGGERREELVDGDDKDQHSEP